MKTAEQENLPALVLPALVEPVETAPQAVQPSAPQIFGNSNIPFTGTSIQASFSASSTTIPTQSTNTTSNVLWGGAAAAMLGATLAEWQRRREEEAARLAALRNSGGGEEEEDRPRKKTAGQIAYEKKQQQKRIVAESQALMNTRKATEKAQNKQAKNKNLAKAEAVMSKAKPVTPYVVSSYLDKEEETWLKGNESQRARATVNAQEQAKKAEQERLNAVSAARWAGIKDIELEKQKAKDSLLVCEVEPEKPKTLIGRILNWVKSPATLFGVATEDETVTILKNADDVPLYLPVIRGITPYIDDVSGPLKTILMDKRTIRALGRFIGDASVPWTIGIGLGLTVAPNLIDNIKNLRSPARITADIMIDAFGFVLSETVGIGVGLLVAAFTGNVYIAGASKIGADIVTSVTYDTFIDSNNVREVLEEYLTPKPGNITPVPKPTPSFGAEGTIGQETLVPYVNEASIVTDTPNLAETPSPQSSLTGTPQP